MNRAWLRALGLVANVAGWLGGLFATRWLLRLSTPHEDARELSRVGVRLGTFLTPIRLFWTGLDSTLGVLVDDWSGAQRVRLEALRARIRKGDYADDTDAASHPA